MKLIAQELAADPGLNHIKWLMPQAYVPSRCVCYCVISNYVLAHSSHVRVSVDESYLLGKCFAMR